MVRCLVVVIALAGCGRIGFGAGTTDGGGDGSGAPDAVDAAPTIDLACNMPLPLGVISTLSPSTDGASWLAAGATNRGLVVGYTTATGLTAVTIDLRVSPPVMSAEEPVAASLGSNLQVAASGDDLLFSSFGTDSAGMAWWLTDPDLVPQGAGVNAEADVKSPDHTARRVGGGFVAVGTTNDTAVAFKIDGAGNVEGTPRSFSFPGARGGAITANPGGGFTAIWDAVAGGPCLLMTLDATASEVARTMVPAPCKFARPASLDDGSRVVLAWNSGGSVATSTYDPGLMTTTGAVTIGSVISSTRTASGADAIGVLMPVSSTVVDVQLMDGIGSQLGRPTLTPYSNAAGDFTVDLVGRSGALYAVWASRTTQPTLYLERLCP